MRTQEQLDKILKVMITEFDVIKNYVTNEQVEGWANSVIDKIVAIKGPNDTEETIAKTLKISVRTYRVLWAVDREARRKEELAKATRYKTMGLTIAEIAKLLDKKESYIKNLLNNVEEEQTPNEDAYQPGERKVAVPGVQVVYVDEDSDHHPAEIAAVLRSYRGARCDLMVDFGEEKNIVKNVKHSPTYAQNSWHFLEPQYK